MRDFLYKRWFNFLLALLLIISSFLAFFFYIQKNQLSNEDNDINNGVNEHEQEITNDTTNWSIPENFKPEIEKIIQGQIDFTSRKDNVNFYSKRFDFANVGLNVEVYKYYPGAKFNDGYEGMSWVTELDETVNSLRNIKIGIKNEIKYKQLGTQKWSIVRSSFPPSASKSFDYASFNPKTNYLTNIYIIFDENLFKERSECYSIVKNDYNDCLSSSTYPDEMQFLLNDLEAILAQF